ncbi:class I SAM-dependent methyltransferase [Luminiphilus sp.]|nr:class I SAM-dependent methyltransferase [Luminiphilus sp.]
MKKMKIVIKAFDTIISPLVAVAAVTLFFYRRIGLQRLTISTKVLEIIGVWPLIRHYYEPKIHLTEREIDFLAARHLPGIRLNREQQLEFLSSLEYTHELGELFHCSREPSVSPSNQFENLIDVNNTSFSSGDAEFLYQFVRATKPRLVVEVGCGISTQIIASALERNEGEGVGAEHICIEPFEAAWLDSFPKIRLIRQPIEEIDIGIFDRLSEGDFLFIDSSHMVRPKGDVLCEILHILPALGEGVNIHFHDVFTPREYIREFIVDQKLFWNEQYLLEAFLSCNRDFDIVAALNYLKHEAFSDLNSVAPYLTAEREPGSIYIKRVKSGPLSD